MEGLAAIHLNNNLISTLIPVGYPRHLGVELYLRAGENGLGDEVENLFVRTGAKQVLYVCSH